MWLMDHDSGFNRVDMDVAESCKSQAGESSGVLRSLLPATTTPHRVLYLGKAGRGRLGGGPGQGGYLDPAGIVVVVVVVVVRMMRIRMKLVGTKWVMSLDER